MALPLTRKKEVEQEDREGRRKRSFLGANPTLTTTTRTRTKTRNNIKGKYFHGIKHVFLPSFFFHSFVKRKSNKRKKKEKNIQLTTTPFIRCTKYFV